MCNVACILFGASNLTAAEIRGRRVLEVGARDVNGSLRGVLASWEPAEYVGVDMEEGPGVDVVCSAEALVERFGAGSFDVVVSTEMLEHVRDWRAVISNLKRVLKPGGILLVTTRSPGFPYHAYPHDYWRYTVGDFEEIFEDMERLVLEPEPGLRGVYLKARKPVDWKEKDLTGMRLQSMVWNRRTAEVPAPGQWSCYRVRCAGRVLMETLFRGCESVCLRVYGFLFRI